MTALLISTADTDLLAAERSGAPWRVANPARVEAGRVPELLSGIDVAVVRLLGGRRTWPRGLDTVLASGIPTVVLGGEFAPDPELMAASTVPSGVAAEALAYLTEGGTTNLRELASFLSDTVLLTGLGFAPPAPFPLFGAHERPSPASGPLPTDTPSPRVGIVYYRAHEHSGNTAFVDALCAAVVEAGGTPAPVF